MNANSAFEIKQYDFNRSLSTQLESSHYAKNLWPVVYILSDGKIKEAYVGETTDTFSRLETHLNNPKKNKLKAVHIVTSEKFNKSATLDIESNLIKYLSGDGQFKLLNGNLGLANHNYYQKQQVYWEMFKSIWDKLQAEGIAHHSLEHINNSDLFKYSPYKSLTRDQRDGLRLIINSILDDRYRNVLIEGGAGTGKTVLAVFLFKLINTELDDFNFGEFEDAKEEFELLVKRLKEKFPAPRMALVVPMSSFRKTLKRIFQNVKGLNANMVIGPAEATLNKYDIILVDESHRLRRRVNLGPYFKPFDLASERLGLDNKITNEVEWIVRQSDKAIFFYDQAQTVKPSDVRPEVFEQLKSNIGTCLLELKSQFRVKGGNDYVKFIDGLLRRTLPQNAGTYQSKDYELVIFDSIDDLVATIKKRDAENGLSRLVAGYSWEWKSKNDKKAFDIEIDNTFLRWNGTPDDWINSQNAIDEVGCIHTTQGYDLNYTGVIFGNEISYDKRKAEIIIKSENYRDKAGKYSITDPQQLKEYIINIYKTIMLRGIKGTYVYACDKDLRAYLSEHIISSRKTLNVKYVPLDEVKPYVNSIPLYNLSAAAGGFSEPQNVTDCEWIELPSRYQASKDLFACQVVGESMNKVIPNGSICLFRKYFGGSRNGMIALVQLTNLQDPETGSQYTVKRYTSSKSNNGESWRHERIVLKAESSLMFDNITLVESEVDNLKILGLFECVII
jgi:DUF2075 family protein/predicted GIY-YIG superfamily endonuclease